MNYLLDTCALIDIMRGNDAIQRRVNDVNPANCYICDIVLAELFVGPFKSLNHWHMLQAQWVEQHFRSLYFHDSYRTYARIRAQLESTGERLDNMDLLIASIAIDNDLTLVTRNPRHFDRIPDLKVEVWE